MKEMQLSLELVDSCRYLNGDSKRLLKERSNSPHAIFK